MRAIRQTILGPLTRYGTQDWIWFILPVAVFLALLLGTGPYLQDFVSRTIDSQQPSYQQGIPRLPDLTEWLVGALIHPYAIISLASLLIAIRREMVGVQAALLAFWIGTLLTISDIIIILTDPVTPIYFPQTVIFNYVGSTVIAGMYILLIGIYFYIYDMRKNHRIDRRLFPASATVGLGTILSSIVFSALSFSYQPATAITLVDLDTDAAAMVVSDTPRVLPLRETVARSENTSDIAFSQMPRSRITGRMQIVNAGDRTFSVGWNSLDNSAEHSVSISAFIDCPFKQISDLPQSDPIIFNSLATSLSIEVDGGNADITLPVSGNIIVSGDTIFSVATEESEEDGYRSLSGFIGNDVGVRYRTADDPTFLVGSTLLESNGRSSIPTAATFNVSIDGVSKKVIVEPGTRAGNSDALNCRSAAILPNDEITSVAKNRVHTSLLVTVNTVTRSPVFQVESHEVNFRSLDGWIEVDSVPLNDIKNQSLGNVAGLFIQSGITRLEVGGRDVSVKSTDKIQLLGKLQGSYGDDGNLNFSGETYAIWRNGVRTNLTRWELLSDGIRVALITALLAAIGTGATLIWRTAKSVGALQRRSHLEL